MKAAVLRAGSMVVRDDVEVPEPGMGQVRIAVKACGICGSDLHFVHHGARMLELGAQMRGAPSLGTAPDLAQDVFMGHEFAGEVLEVGPDTAAPPVGSLVTSIPVMLTASGVSDLVYSNTLPCGYSEQMLVSAPMVVEVPNGLPATHAALTEPMAVGLHAVNRAAMAPRDGAVVLGCGPVGLAVIAALRARESGPIVASDFSPARRALAERLGADEVVDPRVDDPYDAWERVGGARGLVTFDAVGVPGILGQAMRDAPALSKVLVVGVCMEQDTVTPYYGVSKELAVQFAFGYDPMEFATSLRNIAEGVIDVAPLITAQVGIDGVPQAFADLADPEAHCKILVVP